MIYRDFGKTGMRVSVLGFGCMRLPMTKKGGKAMVDDELAIPLMRRAVDLGINFFDTAWFYCESDSQRAVGAALAPVREKVYISTKLPLFMVNKSEDFDEYLDRSLEQMGLDYLDINHFHALTYKTWKEKILPLKLIDRAEKAKAKGLIRHLSFSFHGDADEMGKLIDTGVFSSVLGQYNLVDRTNEDVFAYAKSKGLGTSVMGPLMGGGLSDGGLSFLERMGSGASTSAEMGLRFVWGLPAVDIALSGMSDLQQLEDNAKYAENADSIPAAERQRLIGRSNELSQLSDLYCTGCNYCEVCPQNIQPGRFFQLYLRHKVWGLDESVRTRLADKGPWGIKVYPPSCTSCGACTARCPQKIDIALELKRIWPVLQEFTLRSP